MALLGCYVNETLMATLKKDELFHKKNIFLFSFFSLLHFTSALA